MRARSTSPLAGGAGAASGRRGGAASLRSAGRGWSCDSARRRARRARDQRGGAVSLWVVLMVPVLLGLGLAAMAVPQRLAAEDTVAGAAEDLAVMAVVWRDATGELRGPLDGFPPDCISDDAETEAACHGLWGLLARDLNSQGVDIFSVRGFYGDSYSAAPEISDRPPCRIYGSAFLLDANHVAISADWYGHWAARQLWPDGVAMAAESVGHLNVLATQTGDETELDDKGNECGERFSLVADSGAPRWLAPVPDPCKPSDPSNPPEECRPTNYGPANEARRLSESLPYRTVFQG